MAGPGRRTRFARGRARAWAVHPPHRLSQTRLRCGDWNDTVMRLMDMRGTLDAPDACGALDAGGACDAPDALA